MHVSGNQKSFTLPSELSNLSNIHDHFVSIMQANNAPCEDKISYYYDNKKDPLHNFEFSLTDQEEVSTWLHQIKSSACGIDGISINMLQIASPFIDKYITHLIKICIESNYFPCNWKRSIGLPLPKNSKPNSYSDLRIISILPAFSKIFEKVLYSQLYEFAMSNKIIPSCQAGFRKNFSTATALSFVLDNVVEALKTKSLYLPLFY